MKNLQPNTPCCVCTEKPAETTEDQRPWEFESVVEDRELFLAWEECDARGGSSRLELTLHVRREQAALRRA